MAEPANTVRVYGHQGPQAKYMGEYTMHPRRLVSDCPIFTKTVGYDTCYLYKSQGSSRWVFIDQDYFMEQDKSVIISKGGGAAHPVDAGPFMIYDGTDFVDDPDLCVVATESSSSNGRDSSEFGGDVFVSSHMQVRANARSSSNSLLTSLMVQQDPDAVVSSQPRSVTRTLYVGAIPRSHLSSVCPSPSSSQEIVHSWRTTSSHSSE